MKRIKFETIYLFLKNSRTKTNTDLMCRRTEASYPTLVNLREILLKKGYIKLLQTESKRAKWFIITDKGKEFIKAVDPYFKELKDILYIQTNLLKEKI